jgi:hypothetical protein
MWNGVVKQLKLAGLFILQMVCLGACTKALKTDAVPLSLTKDNTLQQPCQ